MDIARVNGDGSSSMDFLNSAKTKWPVTEADCAMFDCWPTFYYGILYGEDKCVFQ